MAKDGEVSQTDATTIDITSPYYLGSQDGPGATITHVKLRNENYDAWSRSIRMSLKSRRKVMEQSKSLPTKFYLIIGKWLIVPYVGEYTWDNYTAMIFVVQWIMNTIDVIIKDGISYFEEALPLWNNLKERFAVVDGSKVSARQDAKRLHQFFMGLDDTLYGAVRSQQLQLTPLPTLNRAYHIVLQKKRLRGLVSTDAPDIVAYAINAASRQPSPPDWKAIREKEKLEKRKIYCTHCDRCGHDIKTCFFCTNSFLDWWGDGPRVPTTEKGRVGAGSSGTSHTNATVAAGHNKNSLVRPHVITSSRVEDGGPSNDRLRGIYREWIIDTGASNHVTGDITCLTETTHISARHVGLPDGHHIIATLTGTVHLNDRIILRNVLYVSCLTCNLISVSQLLIDNNCLAQFTNSHCFLQDRTTKTTIGKGELQDGLYFWRVVVLNP
ncbi:hypothetical protein RND81_07G092500 [Saponaria officinalis]|uniref:Retrotransposon Copia-like N-terminal domain-containing protein n=1 Tax=Saponaria officinalis TaxID=3572 RepID=A0AAW1JLL1_SAPOF